MQMLMVARYWTKIFVVCVFLSYVAAFTFLLVYQWVNFIFDLYDPAQNGVIYQVMKTAAFWLLQVPHHYLPWSDHLAAPPCSDCRTALSTRS